jgi:hypothetical protein
MGMSEDWSVAEPRPDRPIGIRIQLEESIIYPLIDKIASFKIFEEYLIGIDEWNLPILRCPCPGGTPCT